MKSTNPRIDRLKQLLELEQRRDRLEKELNSVTESMRSLRDSLFDDNGKSAPASAASSSRSFSRSESSEQAAPKGRGGRKPRAKRGALKEQIFSALEAAGQAGVKVTELAKALATKPVNIHSWFHSALSRHPEIKKIQGGHYRLTGRTSSASKEKASASSSQESTSTPESKNGRKPGRPSSKGSQERSSGSRSKSGRGELSQRILSELQGAGAKGVNVRDLAEKIDVPYKNIYVWFATTGKKNGSIKKLGPAHYKIG